MRRRGTQAGKAGEKRRGKTQEGCAGGGRRREAQKGNAGGKRRRDTQEGSAGAERRRRTQEGNAGEKRRRGTPEWSAGGAQEKNAGRTQEGCAGGDRRRETQEGSARVERRRGVQEGNAGGEPQSGAQRGISGVARFSAGVVLLFGAAACSGKPPRGCAIGVYRASPRGCCCWGPPHALSGELQGGRYHANPRNPIPYTTGRATFLYTNISKHPLPASISSMSVWRHLHIYFLSVFTICVINKRINARVGRWNMT